MERLHVVVEGRVQGVGFRYAAEREAKRLGLAGWVRNRHDGAVEAVFEGPRDTLEQMLDWCRRGPSFAKVVRVAESWTDAKGESGFRIVG